MLIIMPVFEVHPTQEDVLVPTCLLDREDTHAKERRREEGRRGEKGNGNAKKRRRDERKRDKTGKRRGEGRREKKIRKGKERRVDKRT